MELGFEVAKSGTPGFVGFAEHLKQVRSLEAELDQETAVRREEYKASLVEKPTVAKNNLSAAFSYHRGRGPNGSTSR